jgi:uncharacterized protein YjbJ (UPF0337 family)
VPTLAATYHVNSDNFDGTGLATLGEVRSYSLGQICVRSRRVMNSDKVKGKWKQLKGEIKRKWGQVTDDDLLQAEGNMDVLIGTIQERTGEQRDAIRQWLDERKY